MAKVVDTLSFPSHSTAFNGHSRAAPTFIESFVVSICGLAGETENPVWTVWPRMWDSGDSDQSFVSVVGL